MLTCYLAIKLITFIIYLLFPFLNYRGMKVLLFVNDFFNLHEQFHNIRRQCMKVYEKIYPV